MYNIHRCQSFKAYKNPLMKKLLVIIMLIACMRANAQDDIKREDVTLVEPLMLKKPAQELGIFTQISYGVQNPDNIGMTGILYKRFKNEHLGYRLTAAYGSMLYDESYSNYRMTPDTFTQRTDRYTVDMALVGAGLEAQRHFYKHYTLFAALELKAGYGSGRMDTAISKTFSYKDGYAVYETAVKANNVNMFYAAFTPTLGIKAESSRLAVGLELLPINISIRNTVYDGKSNLFAANFSLGDFATRVFVNYRF
jgi:hypothetical protein